MHLVRRIMQLHVGLNLRPETMTVQYVTQLFIQHIQCLSDGLEALDRILLNLWIILFKCGLL